MSSMLEDTGSMLLSVGQSLGLRSGRVCKASSSEHLVRPLDCQEAKVKAVEGHSPLGSKGLSPGGGVSPVSPESPDVGGGVFQRCDWLLHGGHYWVFE